MCVTCDICGMGIEPERLDMLPNTRRCAKCAREKGSDALKPLNALADGLMDPDTYRDLLDSIQG